MYLFCDEKTDTGASGATRFGADIMTIHATGTWDGGGLTMEHSNDGVTYTAIVNAAFTEDGSVNVEMAAEAYIRVNITSVGAGSSLTVSAVRKNNVAVT